MDSGSASVIRLRNVTKVFSTEDIETHALSDVTLEVRRGDKLTGVELKLEQPLAAKTPKPQ